MGQTSAERQRQYRARLTEAQREEHKQRNREQKRGAKAAETPEQAEARRKKARDRARERYWTDPEYREKKLSQVKESRLRDPERYQARERLRSRRERAAAHGLTLEESLAKLEAQGNRCAICGSGDPGKFWWHLDHDHGCCLGRTSCGKCVRDYLCGRCNKGLGMFGDDVELLRKAVGYLVAHLGKKSSVFDTRQQRN